MKIIDEKGKIFGIVNLLDLIVAIIVIGVVFVACVTISKNKATFASQLNGKTKLMDVTVQCRMVVPSVATQLLIDAPLLAQNAYTGGHVKSFSPPTVAKSYNFDSNGNTVASTNPDYRDIDVVLETKQDPTSPVLKINGQECRVNAKIFVKTQECEMSGTITNIKFLD